MKSLSPHRLFLAVLLLAPAAPFAALLLRDAVYAAFGWANTETPTGGLSWEIALIAAICWGTAAATAAALHREHHHPRTVRP